MTKDIQEFILAGEGGKRLRKEVLKEGRGSNMRAMEKLHQQKTHKCQSRAQATKLEDIFP